MRFDATAPAFAAHLAVVVDGDDNRDASFFEKQSISRWQSHWSTACRGSRRLCIVPSRVEFQLFFSFESSELTADERHSHL